MFELLREPASFAKAAADPERVRAISTVAMCTNQGVSSVVCRGGIDRFPVLPCIGEEARPDGQSEAARLLNLGNIRR